MLIRHPNDSSEWTSLSLEEGASDESWISQAMVASDIDSHLKNINHVAALDINRFICVSVITDNVCEIGLVKIEWRTNDKLRLKTLNSRKLFVETYKTILAYDIRLGSSVYFISTSHFVVYNFQTFKLRVLDLYETEMMSIIEEPISLLIIDQTHLLVGSDTSTDKSFDEPYSHGALIVVELDFSASSSLCMSILSNESIVAPGYKKNPLKIPVVYHWL